MGKRILCTLLLTLAASAVADAATPPCRPCAGIVADDPAAIAGALRDAPGISEDGRLYAAWTVDLATEPASQAAAAEAVEGAGATAWLRLVFHTPVPVLDHLAELEVEIQRAARLARGAGPTVHFQILWQPSADGSTGEATAADYAFLFKRAGVAVSGARPDARVITQPLEPDPEHLDLFYAEEVAAYVDGIALSWAPSEILDVAFAHLAELDPGRPIVVEAVPFPDEPTRALGRAAELARQGAGVVLFDLARPTAADLTPLTLLANEFRGDLSYDPYSVPTGGGGAWSFVRGEDLGLRVVVEAETPTEETGSEELVLLFSDPQLRRPARVDPATGEVIPLAGVRRSPRGLELRVYRPDPVTVLRLDRPTIAELEGVEEEVTITDERQMPVAEILRRLQAFEDAQYRKLHTYQATNTTHLRFQASAGAAGTFEATLQGDFFFRRDQGFDWAWQDLYVNGIKWRSKKLPEIPLIQPEKAATLPLTIELDPRYRYSLRGSEVVDGRDCWVVEFRPSGEEIASEEKLFRGAVWVDKEIYARVRTRAVQLGLEGEVLSNEETVFFSPIDASGAPAPWSPDSYFLPLRTLGQQLWSVLNTATVVEREVLLSGLEIDAEDFAEARAAVFASDATMVRDTDDGLRYLVKEDGSDERVVKEGFDANKLFLLGGVFWDDSLDFPLPLAGLNYFSFDFRGTGNQLNAFFGGVLGTVDYSDPSFLGSKWDAGADAFVFGFPRSDSVYRDGREIVGEEIESQVANVSVLIGRPIGNFFKFRFEYELDFDKFGRTDDTAEDFVLPSDHFTHSLELDARFARSGYQLGVEASFNQRSEWEPWGLPGNPDYDPEHEDYLLWQLRLSKNFHLPNFQRLGVEVDYFGGEDLDRFSKYGFGFFGPTRVHGYRSDRVRADEGYAAHITYGFEVGEVFRLQGIGDAAWATDEATGLDNELLGGVGIVGQFIGPWQTLVQLDVGVPVAGPDDGVVVYVVFLKLFG